MTTPQYGSDATRKLPLSELVSAKRDGRPLVMITAYDYPSGRIAERAGVDMVLVGDSAAMVVLGHTSTVPATMDEMLMLTAAVTRACRRPIVVADLPFMSYQVSDEDALRAAGRFLKEAAADAVKLEGAGPMLARIRALAGAGIPVVAHLGLTPQTATSQGGFRAQGKTAQAALRLLHDAHAAEAAGAFALVLEAVPAPVAERISSELDIPTIGIGAGAGLRRPGARVPRPAGHRRGPAAALRRALRRARRPRGRCRHALGGRRARAPLPAGAAHLHDRARRARALPAPRRRRHAGRRRGRRRGPVTGDELAALLAGAGSPQLLDVRSAAEYDGSAGYPCDPRQGHIPGAVNVDVSEIAGAGAGLRGLLAEHGIDLDAPVVCYCHSGGRSAYATALLVAAGIAAENYEGSWHEWSRREAA